MCEDVGHHLATDAAVHEGSAVFPSANAGLDDRVSDVALLQATDGVVRYDNEFSFFSPSPYSSDIFESGGRVEIGAVPPNESNQNAVVLPLPDLRRRLASDGLPLGTPDDNSQVDDKSRDNVRIDEFGYIYDLSDNDYDEFLVDENGIHANITGISAEQDVDSGTVDDTIEKELDDRKVETTFVSQNVDFTNSVNSTGSRPRRNIRRPRKYDGFSTQFTNSQHIRRIRRDFQANLRSSFERPSFHGIRSQAAEPRAVAQVPRSEKLNEDIQGGPN